MVRLINCLAITRLIWIGHLVVVVVMVRCRLSLAADDIKRQIVFLAPRNSFQ